MNTQKISGGIMLTFAQVKVEQPESQPESLTVTKELIAHGVSKNICGVSLRVK